jgi:hypothetical protein
MEIHRIYLRPQEQQQIEEEFEKEQVEQRSQIIQSSSLVSVRNVNMGKTNCSTDQQQSLPVMVCKTPVVTHAVPFNDGHW